jgi:hypothetical protein
MGQSKDNLRLSELQNRVRDNQQALMIRNLASAQSEDVNEDLQSNHEAIIQKALAEIDEIKKRNP